MADDDSTRARIEGFMATTFGVGAGKLSLRLVETQLAPGDVVRGRIELELREPAEAKRIIVRVRASQLVGSIQAHTTTTGSGTPGRRDKTSTGLSFSEREIYVHDHELEGERLYHSGEGFDFAVKLPPRQELTTPDNPVARAVRFVNDAMTPIQGQVKWYLQARLVFAWHKKDITRELQLQVE